MTQTEAGYRLRADEHQWIVQKMRRKRVPGVDNAGSTGTGEAYWQDDKFYPNLELAALYMLELVERASAEARTLAEIVIVQRRSRQYILNEIRRLCKNDTGAV